MSFKHLLLLWFLRNGQSFVLKQNKKIYKHLMSNKDTIPFITSNEKIHQIQERQKKLHEEEIQRGIDIFDSTMKITSDIKSWTDDDFISYDVGIGNAGPDEYHMNNANHVYATIKPVFTKDECSALISEAREYIFQTLDSSTSSTSITNSNLGEAMVSNLPQASKWLKKAMKDQLFPLLNSRFGVSDLTLNDALIIGYGCFHKSSNYTQPVQSQPMHRDASLISLNIALSPKQHYDSSDGGGGTYFEGVNDKNPKQGAIQMEQGHVLCHSSGAMHAGNGIQYGERWVLVLFCLSKSIPQIARRCHSEGMILKQKGDYDSSIATLEAGIQIAPKDHLLTLTLGSIYAILGHNKDKTHQDWITSQNYLQKTASLYTIDPNPLLALGKLYLEQRNAYKAYQCFDIILKRNSHDSITWIPLKAALYEARVYAGQCAVICAEEEAMGMKFPNSNPLIETKSPFTIQVLPQAIQYMMMAIDLNPKDQRLCAMLSRANELLEHGLHNKSKF